MIRSVAHLEGLEERSTLLFFDWNYASIPIEERMRLCRMFLTQMRHRFYVVAPDGQKELIESAIGTPEIQVLVTPISDGQMRGVLQDVQRKNVSSMKLDVIVINGFLSAASEAFAFLAGLEISREGMQLIHPRESRTVACGFLEMTAFMEFTGDYVGAIAVTLTRKLAHQITATALASTDQKVTKTQVRDCTGELLNVLSGAASKSFEDTPYSFQIGLPKIREGTAAQFPEKCSNAPVLRFNFGAQGHDIRVLVAIEPAHEGAPKLATAISGAKRKNG